MARPTSIFRHGLPWAMPLVLLLVAGGLLAGAFAFEIWGGLKPCALCLYQRWPHGLVVIFAGLALGAAAVRGRTAGPARVRAASVAVRDGGD